MSHFKNIWLVGWLAVAGVALALALRSTAPEPVAELAVRPASLEPASPQTHAARNIEDFCVGHAAEGEPEQWRTGQ